MSAKPKGSNIFEGSTPSLEEILNEALTDAYNEHISSRLESLRGWTSGDEWAKGFKPYYTAVINKLLDQLVFSCKTRDEDQYLRGKIAAMKEVVGFRDLVLRQIETIERNKNQGPKGDAGY